jgi:uncharacterized membrane protein YfcA
MYIKILYTIIVGYLSGIFGGSIGIAGSAIMLPGIIILDIIPNYKKAIGTVLFACLPPISLLAVIEYYKKSQIDYSIGIFLCISYFIGAYCGAKLNGNSSIKTIKYLCAIVFTFLTGHFYYDAYNSE